MRKSLHLHVDRLQCGLGQCERRHTNTHMQHAKSNKLELSRIDVLWSGVCVCLYTGHILQSICIHLLYNSNNWSRFRFTLQFLLFIRLTQRMCHTTYSRTQWILNELSRFISIDVVLLLLTADMTIFFPPLIYLFLDLMWRNSHFYYMKCSIGPSIWTIEHVTEIEKKMQSKHSRYKY